MLAIASIPEGPCRQGSEVAMGNLKIEACPRCKNGYLTLDKDFYGWYEYCVQCGYIHDLPDLPKINRVAVKSGKNI